jgi:hypothetical protein
VIVIIALSCHFEALKAFDILLGDSPALSDSEALCRKMLAVNLTEAIAVAKSFMATRTFSEYCDAVARPALLLAQKDFQQGELEDRTLTVFQTTFAKLFEEIARKPWANQA